MQDRLLEVVTAVEVVTLQDVLDPAVEALYHVVGLWMHRRCESMLDPDVSAEAVEIVVAGRGALAQAEEPVGELFAVARREKALLTGYGRLRSLQIAERVASSSPCARSSLYGGALVSAPACVISHTPAAVPAKKHGGNASREFCIAQKMPFSFCSSRM